MANSSATYTRSVVVDFPDWASSTVYFYLESNFAAAGNEGFPQKEYTLALDANGQGTQVLPVPDNTGDASWLWRIKTPDTPDNNHYRATLAYSASSIQLTAWLASALSTETANSIADQFVQKGGDTMTGPLILSGDPAVDLGAATKQYVDDNIGGGGAVDSVFARTGDVVAATSDYDADQVDFNPAGTIAATNVQAAIEELDSEKSATGHTHSYQPLDAGLTDLAGLAVTDGNIPVGDGSNWVAESGATARASLGAASLRPAENEQTGTTYTLALTDEDKIVKTTNGSAVTVTIPPNSSVAFPTGAIIGFRQYGAGALSWVAGAGVTIRSLNGSLSMAGQYGEAAAQKIGTDEWLLVGALA